MSDKKINESGFRPPLCTYRLNWARRTSWGWWDDWDDTVLQTQDSKFEPWRSEAEHATSRSRRLPTILTFTRGWGRNIFVSFKPPRPGTEPRTLAWKAAVLTTTLGPPPYYVRHRFVCPIMSDKPENILIDFNRNAIVQILFYRTTILAILYKHIKITIRFSLCQTCYQFIVSAWTVILNLTTLRRIPKSWICFNSVGNDNYILNAWTWQNGGYIAFYIVCFMGSPLCRA